MDNLSKMEEILKGIRETNNDLHYQSIVISTNFPNLPVEVKSLLAAYAIDHESSAAIIRNLGKDIVNKDKLIATLDELTKRQKEIIDNLENP